MPDVRRLVALAGFASVALWLGQFPLYLQDDPSVSVYDGAALVRDFARVQTIVFTRVLLNLGAYVTGMVFASGLAHLIRQARPAYEWVANLVFGSFAVWMGVTLVANGLEGGAVLDTLGGGGDPSAVRALKMGTLLVYNGSIAFAITGLFLGTAGYATFVSGVLPRWTGWLAYAGAALCALSVPAMYGGPVSYAGFYNTGGWWPVVIANVPPALWFIAASVALLRPQPGRTR